MEFKLPDIGEGVHEGEITKWLIQTGDAVEIDQPMVEVMTDKATVELPSPVKGKVEALMADEGETVEVGKVILKIAENGASAAAAPVETAPAQAAAPTPEPSSPAPAPQSAPEAESSIPFKVLATPATRKLARDLSLDITQVTGTGANGRVTKEDVQLYYESTQAATPRSSHPTTSSTAVSRPTQFTKPAIITTGEVERIPLKGIRKRIAESMVISKQTAAHFTYVDEVDMSAVVKLRKEYKAEAETMGVKLTFLPFIIKALISSLKDFPYLNASLDDDAQEIVLKKHYNIGVATDTDRGLMVPVIHEADRKSIFELANEIVELSEKARTGKLTPNELKGGTFTVTNAGTIGGVFTAPVINYPEVAIMGVNAIRKRPIVRDDKIVIADMMYLSMAVDHRVVDGADAARFVNKMIYFLSEPKRLVFA